VNGALSELCAVQNPDGGWPYRAGSSWTEPTVFASLALASEGEVYSQAVGRGLNWLRANQRRDGGFAPRPLVEDCTWVTALVLLLPAPMLARFHARGALDWLLSKTGRESSWVQGLRVAMISGRVDRGAPEGWPWFPDTAAWVSPTSFAILALRKASQRDPRDEIRDRIQRGQEFLMSSVCEDGGWNHGSTKALGYEAPSYPETTGLALLALDDLPPSRVARSVERAKQYLQATRSLEAASWLHLGLLAHRQAFPPAPTYATRSRSTQEVALAAILRRALDGDDVFGAP